jgi:ABC-type transport system substrate-binding protein
MWGELGIDVQVNTVEQAVYILDVVSGAYQASWWRNFGYTDPDFDYIFWHSSQSTPPPGISINFTHTEDPTLDALLDEAREVAETPEERKVVYEKVVQQLNVDLSHIWLFHTPAALIAKPDVRGLNPVRERGGFGTFEPKPWVSGLWVAPTE